MSSHESVMVLSEMLADHDDILELSRVRRFDVRPLLERQLAIAFAKLCWQKVRDVVKVRRFAMHWWEETGKTSCAPGGSANKRHREEYEADFCKECLYTML